eukprot:c5027_g1_i1.p1 GENE.c5027_g1_i1~~c5027_g1_i1.p1  ORF type:complete len:290 (+),score=34.58 c5027_g1_i1:39-872(+)
MSNDLLQVVQADVNRRLSRSSSTLALAFYANGNWRSRFRQILYVTKRSHYFWGCVVYLIYASGILIIDYYPWTTSESEGSAGDHPRQWSAVNVQFLCWGFVHLVNAFQFLFAWMQVGIPAMSTVCIPEYLNMLEALLYIYSAFNYPSVSNLEYDDPRIIHIHHIELSAAIIEIFAAIGWCITWWWTYNRTLPGRGWTLDDLDVWACFFIVVPSFIYLVYNIQILSDLDTYGTNLLYMKADICYFVGAVIYVLVSLRDCGWFYGFPVAGGWDWKFSKE